jgi:hypothetical protein
MIKIILNPISMKYKVKAKAEFEADFIIDDDQLISYFGTEKFATINKEVLLKQIISESENNWNQTELKLEINNNDE